MSSFPSALSDGKLCRYYGAIRFFLSGGDGAKKQGCGRAEDFGQAICHVVHLLLAGLQLRCVAMLCQGCGCVVRCISPESNVKNMDDPIPRRLQMGVCADDGHGGQVFGLELALVSLADQRFPSGPPNKPERR